MKFIDNLRISGKAAIPVVFVTTLLVGVVVVANFTLARVASIATVTIQQTDPAVFKSIGTNRLVGELVLSVYRSLSYEDGSADLVAVEEQFPKTMATIERNFLDLQEMLPDHGEDIEGLRRLFSTVKNSLVAQFEGGNRTNGFTMGTANSPEDIDRGAELARQQVMVDVLYNALAAKFEKLNDVVLAESAEQARKVEADSQFAISLLIGLGVSSVLLGMGVALFLTSRTISRPLNRLNVVMRELAGGNNSVEIPGTGRKDEIGQMAGAVETFREAALSNLRLEEEAAADRSLAEEGRRGAETDKSRNEAERARLMDLQSAAVKELGLGLARLAEGDLTAFIEDPFDGELDKLRIAYNEAISRFSHTVGRLRQTSAALKTATGEILSGANDLADRTTKQAAALEETSAAMEQLARTVDDNARRSENASSRARIVSETAQQTGEVMERSDEAMQRISASSSKISNIIGMIDDIAFQTNLLALNASVEAARAGDAGKGFAVVAVEVRRLAQSAAQASSEVKQLIEKSAVEVAAGGRLVADAAQKLVSMVESVKDSASLIMEISTASHQQSAAISQVSSAIRQMDEMTQHNAALVEQTNAAIEQTEGQANDLDKIVEQFVLSEGEPASVHGDRAAAPRSEKVVSDQGGSGRHGAFQSHGNAAVQPDWSEF